MVARSQKQDSSPLGVGCRPLKRAVQTAAGTVPVSQAGGQGTDAAEAASVSGWGRDGSLLQVPGLCVP